MPPITIKLAAPDGVSVTNILTVKPDQQTKQLLKQGSALLKESTADKLFKREWFLSSLLGAAVAVFAGWVLHKVEVRDRRKEEGEFTENVLKAIEAELDALRDIFNQGIGQKLKAKTGRMFLVRLALSQDYFTIYGTNGVHLGKIEPNISNAVITLYQKLKALIESFRINNEYAQMYEAVLDEQRTIGDIRSGLHPALLKKGQELERYLEEQGDYLVKLTDQVEQQHLALKALLRERRERLAA